MNYKLFLKSLKNDLFYANEKYSSVKFFRRDIVHVWVWFLVLDGYYNNKHITTETIINEIPKKYSSRPKIFEIIKNAYKKNFFKKQIDKIDKRKINLHPSELTIEQFEEWSKIFKGF